MSACPQDKCVLAPTDSLLAVIRIAKTKWCWMISKKKFELPMSALHQIARKGFFFQISFFFLFEPHSNEFQNRAGSLEVPQRKSPATPRTARQLKTPGSDSDAVASSPNPASRTAKDRSPKVIERRSPRSPMSEVFSCNSQFKSAHFGGDLTT